MSKFAVIVTYNPNLSNVKRLLSSLIRSNIFPVVVDNSDVDSFSNTNDEEFKVISLYRNTGIARAQNVGIDYCIEKKAKTIIFFDQDSVIPDESFLPKLFNPIIDGGEKITAPIYVDNAKGFTYPIVSINDSGSRTKVYPKSSDENFYTNIVISSGTVVSSDVFATVGVMDESLFIDYVDTEWCLRCHRESIPILVVPNAVMSHSIGDDVIDLFFFKAPVHSAFRRYYRIRNSIFLLRFAHVPIMLAVREIFFSMLHQVVIIVFRRNKIAQIKCLFRGLYDGIFEL
jgi:rhamnosyltransferase